jgi:hypothetical protein
MKEYEESYGLAYRMLCFAVDNGNRFPDRLEQMAAAGTLGGRQVTVLGESKDGSTIYRVGDLNVVYLGAGQPLTDKRERVIALIPSSVTYDMTYEIGSNGSARIVMEWQNRSPIRRDGTVAVPREVTE